MTNSNNYVPPANNGQTAMNPLNYVIIVKKSETSEAIVGSAKVGSAKVQ